jgi:hypothetical protein
LTPEKIRAVRLKLCRVLWRRFPEEDAISIGLAVNAIMQVVLKEAVDLATMPHEQDCVCWSCVLDLHCSVLMHQAQLRIAHEAEEEFD